MNDAFSRSVRKRTERCEKSAYKFQTVRELIDINWDGCAHVKLHSTNGIAIRNLER